MEEKNNRTNWSVSIMELENGVKKYKVTRRLVELSVSETKLYKNKSSAKKKFNEWLK